MRRTLQKWNTRLAALTMAALLLLTLAPAAFAAEASGTCGDAVNWSLSGGVLTISGKGAMADYDEFALAPWNSYADSIRSVRVEKGVTHVGNFAFFRLDKVTSVVFSSSVKSVGEYACYDCSALELLELGSVKSIGESAFERCRALKSLRLPNTLTSVGNQAFYRCESIVSVTVPASVTHMGVHVFGYCAALRYATILAKIDQLPQWTFYGCGQLASVSMAPSITQVGENAFYDCEKLDAPDYNATDGKVEHQFTETIEQNGATITTDSTYSEDKNGSVNTQVTTTKSDSGKDVSVQIDATLEDSDGWKDVEEKLNSAPSGTDSAQVTVNLQGESVLSGKDLGRFAGKDVELTVRTPQGALWHINGTDISQKDLLIKYDLSYTLKELTDPTQEQAEMVGDARSFVVVFAADIDFKAEVELPLGRELARETAVFFALCEDGYQRTQSVLIDAAGIAHFYLEQVQAKAEHLIGINVPTPGAEKNDPSEAIIPDTMTHEYPKMDYQEEVKYVVTGVKSSLGINIVQLTWIIVGVLLGSFIVVGAVLFALNKKKLKSGYVPVLDDEDE